MLKQYLFSEQWHNFLKYLNFHAFYEGKMKIRSDCNLKALYTCIFFWIKFSKQRTWLFAYFIMENFHQLHFTCLQFISTILLWENNETNLSKLRCPISSYWNFTTYPIPCRTGTHILAIWYLANIIGYYELSHVFMFRVSKGESYRIIWN